MKNIIFVEIGTVLSLIGYSTVIIKTISVFAGLIYALVGIVISEMAFALMMDIPQ